MANAIYDLFVQELMKGNANNLLNSAEGTTGVYVALVDTGVYTFSQSHQYYTALSGAVVGTDQEILSKTQTGGVFDGADVSFPATTGVSIEAIVLYRKNAGASSTWPLIAYLDTGITGLPLTPTSLPITIQWNASGIFKL